jgi:hypothetical protein
MTPVRPVKEDGVEPCECRSRPRSPYSGVARHLADPWPGANQGVETGGAPRQRGSGFRASLTELEVTGTQAVSAESIATGKSAELAGEEVARAAGGGVTIVTGGDFRYPPRLKEIYDPRLVLSVRGNPAVLRQPGNARRDDYQRHGAGSRHRQPSQRDRGQSESIAVFGTGVDVT